MSNVKGLKISTHVFLTLFYLTNDEKHMQKYIENEDQMFIPETLIPDCYKGGQTCNLEMNHPLIVFLSKLFNARFL